MKSLNNFWDKGQKWIVYKKRCKTKNCKTFYESQTGSPISILFSLPPNHNQQINSYFVSGTKIFLRRYTEIYRHFLSKCFKNGVLGRQEMVQCKFFSDPKQKHVWWKRLNLAVLREYIIFNVKWVEVRKMSEVFERNCIVKWVIFFASFCWLWDFLLENLILKKLWCPLEHLNEYKSMPEIRIQARDFVSFIFWFKCRYFGDCFRVF